ncbi:MAG: nucleotide exchange factor GrpE, partial [Bacteroidota bacterium]
MEQNEQDNMNLEEENTTSNQEETTEQEAENTSTAEPLNFEAKIAELNDKYLRLYSEFDNYRKRMIKEKADIIRSAGEDVFKAFIPTIDDFERAIKANETV